MLTMTKNTKIAIGVAGAVVAWLLWKRHKAKAVSADPITDDATDDDDTEWRGVITEATEWKDGEEFDLFTTEDLDDMADADDDGMADL